VTAQPTAELPPAALKQTVTSGELGTILVEVLAEHGSGTYEVTLTREDLERAGYHDYEDCPDQDFVHVDCIDPGYEELLEGVVDDLHRAAHNDPGDRDKASDCLRYPCRRLGT
jgi:hypothetical protein